MFFNTSRYIAYTYTYILFRFKKLDFFCGYLSISPFKVVYFTKFLPSHFITYKHWPGFNEI